ncbi:hypothetical protein [Massilia sp. CT11-137]|uniref:hypothetical protein n=1 Tax=Massilia sp. CT11-137 TaxID=3393901 RepID=UPI0039AF65B8
MNEMPKKGTIERIVLDKLLEAGDQGVTHFDFYPPISEAQLAQAIENLKNGAFEVEDNRMTHGYPYH